MLLQYQGQNKLPEMCNFVILTKIGQHKGAKLALTLPYQVAASLLLSQEVLCTCSSKPPMIPPVSTRTSRSVSSLCFLLLLSTRDIWIFRRWNTFVLPSLISQDVCHFIFSLLLLTAWHQKICYQIYSSLVKPLFL